MNISGKNILVTGGAGFIGSHLVDMLLEDSVKKVIVFDNFIRGGTHNLEKALKDNRLELFHVRGDLQSLDQIVTACKGVDGVFHLASLSLPHCQKYPRSALNTNITGTFNLLDACVKNNVSRVVFTSSSSVYGNALYIPMDEKHPLEYRDMYAATKIAGEALFRAFYYKYSLEYIALRFMNIYGPRLDYNGTYVAIIMKIIDHLEQNRGPSIYGDGSQSYDFVYVKDACRSLILAMNSDLTCETYNISSGKQISILDLCKKIQKIMKTDLPIKFFDAADVENLVINRVGSTEKAKSELEFVIRVSLEDGLKRVIDWKLSQ